jgi:hypothetical protein
METADKFFENVNKIKIFGGGSNKPELNSLRKEECVGFNVLTR